MFTVVWVYGLCLSEPYLLKLTMLCYVRHIFLLLVCESFHSTYVRLHDFFSMNSGFFAGRYRKVMIVRFSALPNFQPHPAMRASQWVRPCPAGASHMLWCPETNYVLSGISACCLWVSRAPFH